MIRGERGEVGGWGMCGKEESGGRIDDHGLALSASSAKRERSRHTNPGTKAEPQQIVAQGLLSCLQYLVP